MCNKLATIHFLEDRKEHILYDLSITDLIERKKNACILHNAKDVANLLGVTVKKVFNNRLPGKTITSAFNNKKFAVRLIVN